MKRTHRSVGIYDRSYQLTIGRLRKKHHTACGTICDYTKATLDPTKVTCKLCLKKG